MRFLLYLQHNQNTHIMKKTQLQFEYENFVQDCSYFGIRPTYIKFAWEYMIDKFLSFYSIHIAPTVCKYKGHDWVTESGGDAESGPITCSYCTRCGHVEKPQFGM
jgi:hypothetical protein